MIRTIRNMAAVVFLIAVFSLPTPTAAQDSCDNQQYICGGDSVTFQNCGHSCDYLENRCILYCGFGYDSFSCTEGPGGATGRCDCEPPCP